MEYDLLITRSITGAQRMEMELAKFGIYAQIFRAPVSLTERGCSYAVRVRADKLQGALAVLRQAGLSPTQIFLNRNGAYYEGAI
ncbi:MAG: putative Se/S carrier-like protein [Oscillospiraceae bacterium]